MSDLLLAVGLWSVVVGGCARTADGGKHLATAAEPVEAIAPAEGLIDQWGVEILGLSATAGGYMLDFRFRVHDPQKAETLFSRKIPPILIDESTGARLFVPNPPKVGQLRTVNPPKEGRNYFMIFANPGQRLKPGVKVSIEVGEFHANGLIIQ